MKIGYQGISGSHSQRAAKRLAEMAAIFEPDYIPLGSSENVVTALMKGSIDYGVVPVYNSAYGEIEETGNALKNARYIKVTAVVIPIIHCVFKLGHRSEGLGINKLLSTARTFERSADAIKKYFPYARLKEIEDDALGAKNLSEGAYDRYTAVICGREAGAAYGLTLIYEDIDNGNSDDMVFYLISRPPKQT